MTEDEIDDANARLREPPDFDPANSARLGLFVVALLAARLGAQITLRRSPYGGITAVVLVPRDLIDNPPELPVAAEQRAAGYDNRLHATVTPEPPPAGRHAAAELEFAGSAVQTELPVPQVHEVLDAGLTEDGLPRRVRGYDSLDAEQSTVVGLPAEPQPEPPPPSAEMRAKMSAFQAGTARGRRDAQSGTHDLEQEI